MRSFKDFFIERSEEDKNIDGTLKKLPKAFRDLIKGYKFNWHCGNTLNGDDGHVGVIDPKKKTITVSAPWNYGREFTLLHELAHKVFENFMTPELLDEWKKILKNTKKKMKQNPEELFCMAFANHFVKNKITIHDHPEWDAFIKKIVKLAS